MWKVPRGNGLISAILIVCMSHFFLMGIVQCYKTLNSFQHTNNFGGGSLPGVLGTNIPKVNSKRKKETAFFKTEHRSEEK